MLEEKAYPVKLDEAAYPVIGSPFGGKGVA